jgi:hypothetical protein
MLVLASKAHAEEPARRLDLGAAMGYAFPVASAEAGSRVSDTTIGLVAFEGDVAYRLASALAIDAWGRYGLGIPTLCKSAGDCSSSLGNDVALAVRARFFLPAFGSARPHADVGVGYEWFATRLTDSGVTSTRTYHGPVLLSADAAAPFRLSDRWTLGPELSATLGTFSSYALETPANTSSGPVSGRALHLWIAIGVRLGVSL